jgi:hypothetical protein
MVQVKIDAATRERLRAAEGTVELVDENGHPIGYFQRILPPPYDESIIPPMSREELQRRINEPGGRSLEEILKDLKDPAA